MSTSRFPAASDLFRNVLRRVFRQSLPINLLIVPLLGIAIGANAGLFSIAYSALIRPLPFRDSERLVWIDEFNPQQGAARGVSWLMAQALKGEDSPVEIALFRTTASFIGSDLPLEQAWVTVNLPELLRAGPGPKPAAWAGPPDGIYFRDEETMRLSAASIGDSLQVDSESRQVLGVAPWTIDPLASAQAFGLLDENRVSAQLGRFGAAQANDIEAFHIFQAVGRLRPGVSIQQAEEALNQVQQESSWRMRATPLQDHLVGEATGRTIRLMQLMLLMSLAVACGATASLQAARSLSHRRETAIRIAFGASRGRVRAEALSESVILSLLAGLAGLIVAFALLRMAPAVAPVQVFRSDQAQLDFPVLGFVLLISVISGVATGFWPALRNAGDSLAAVLGHGGTVTEGRGCGGWIVSFQTALSTALLVAAFASLLSLAALNTVELGFEPEESLAVQVSLDVEPKAVEGRFLSFVPDLIQNLESIPGVVSASVSKGLPFEDFTGSLPFSPLPPDAAELAGERRQSAPYALVSRVAPGYFRSMGIPILEGRSFEWRHTLDAPDVAVVSRSLSRRLFGTESPVGRGFTIGVGRGRWVEVAGVVGDIRHLGPGKDLRDHIYVPILQSPFLFLDHRRASFEVILRTEGPPQGYSSAVRNRIEAGSWNLKVEKSRTLAEYLDRPYLVPRFLAGLTGFFAFFSVSITLAGLFGLASREALRREREMAIRSALGGGAGHLASQFLRETASWLIPGLAAGSAGAFLLSRGLNSYLYQVSLSDPSLYLLAISLLASTGLAIAVVPVQGRLRRNLIEVLNAD